MTGLVRRSAVAIGIAAIIVTGSIPAQADGTVGNVTRFAAGGKVQHPLIDADGQGRATATWIRIGREREAWTSDFDGRSWSCPKVLPGSKGALGYSGATWDLAEAANGAAVLGGALNSEGAFEGVAVWTRAAAGRPWVQVRWTDPDSFAILQRTGPPSVALTGSTALVSWVSQDSSTGTVFAAKIPVGSTAAITPTVVYTKSMKGWIDTDPDVGIDAQGNGLIQFEDWVDDANPLFLTKWPAGGAPATEVLRDNVLTKDWLTSMHVNAAGQMISSWGYAPDGAEQYQQFVGFGNSITGLTSESVWQSFGAEGVYSYPNTVGSDIDAAGNASLMLVYENQVIAGQGSVAGGVGSLAPRAAREVTMGGEGWDVTVTDGRAIVSLENSAGDSLLWELRGSELATVATAPGTSAPNSALVKVGGARVPAMVGTGAGESAFRTNLPTKVGRCGRR